MELRTKRIVEELFVSLSRGPFPMFGVESADHRRYEVGDEPRRTERKVRGRTDKLYIEQFRNETIMRRYLLLDASLSMDYRRGTLSKLEYGCYPAALAFLMLEQNDSVGPITFDARPRQCCVGEPLFTVSHCRGDAAAGQCTLCELRVDTGSPAPLRPQAERFHQRDRGVRRGGREGAATVQPKPGRPVVRIALLATIQLLVLTALALGLLRHGRRT